MEFLSSSILLLIAIAAIILVGKIIGVINRINCVICFYCIDGNNCCNAFWGICWNNYCCLNYLCINTP